MKLFFKLMLGLALIALSCENNQDTVPNDTSVQLIVAFPNLDFTRLVDLQNAGNNYLYAVEQAGVIRIFENDTSTTFSQVFLNIEDLVNDRDNEQGLLGLAFHPQFQSNGFFFVNYTTNQQTTRISRFTADPTNHLVALVNSEKVLLEFDQPYTNHNGGQLAFGPDGFLYIAVGDGGLANDPQSNGQNNRTFLGTILRINVDQTNGSVAYGIPSDNPFVGNQQGLREEIYAYGLRNPWRMSFDSRTGNLYAADVGQGEFEEIDIIVNGGNYGWNVIEGPDCFQQASCDKSSYIAPYFSYEHDNGNVSITGGFVYRGAIASLQGLYIYADYISGRIWALSSDQPTPMNNLLVDTNLSISTFGIDQNEELFVCSLDGTIYRFQ